MEEIDLTPNPWIQRLAVKAPGSGGGSFTPSAGAGLTSGKVRISYLDSAGTRFYWNGSAFVSGSPINLATTITGDQSKYNFTAPSSVMGKVLLFEGWVNDDFSTYDWRMVKVVEKLTLAF